MKPLIILDKASPVLSWREGLWQAEEACPAWLRGWDQRPEPDPGLAAVQADQIVALSDDLRILWGYQP